MTMVCRQRGTAHDGTPRVTGPSNGPGCHELDVAPAYGGQPFGLAALAGWGISVSRVVVWRCQAGKGSGCGFLWIVAGGKRVR